jgi:holo-[acyl-carrier protein] synthase
MRLASGVDLVEIKRMEAAIERHGGHFLSRIFTPTELAFCRSRVESLAARFAAKEAVAKALGRGIGEISWRDIEVSNDDLNTPILTLSGAARRLAFEQGLDIWSVSLSHERQFAIAFVVALGS